MLITSAKTEMLITSLAKNCRNSIFFYQNFFRVPKGYLTSNFNQNTVSFPLIGF